MSVCRLALGRLAPALPRALPARGLSLAVPRPGDTPTHTGQTWGEQDLRNVRFSVTGATKQVNDQWAIDLIAAVPVTKVKTRVVACDGGGLPSTGHPRIFINLDHGKAESCNYCGLRFELEH